MTDNTIPFDIPRMLGATSLSSPDDAPFAGFTHRITPWRKNRTKAGETPRHALIMPGIGYTVDRPLLYWATQALAAAGWYVSRLEISLDPSLGIPGTVAALNEAVDEWADTARVSAAASGDTPDLLIVAKSLSTFTYPHAAQIGVRAALLTPVLAPASLDPTRTVIPVPGDADWTTPAAGTPAPLVCAGSADTLFDEARARALTDDVHVYPGANHSIEIPGDWATSIDYLKDVTGQVVRYAG